ncbi:TPA: 50S ribosomal protein L4 [Patescibacteria group bacterium]|nr:50S ribosomal protein L4 [Candidatus Gracilibacteria bacterium]
MKLSDSLFGTEVKTSLIHRLLLLQRANARVAIAHTKNR